jgi:hypothetical protein
MKHRTDTGTQDLADLRTALKRPGGWFDTLVRTVSRDTLTQQAILDSYLWMIGLGQRVADVPTWLGAYEKAMDQDAEGRELEAHEARAVALADQAVLDSQGGGQIKDLAAVQRGGGAAKAWLAFYSYGNTVLNATADVAGQTNFKSPAAVATFLGHLSLLYLLPALGTVTLGRLLGRRGGADDDPEAFLVDVGQEVLSSAMNGVVLLRELTQLVGDGTRGYAGPSGARFIQTLYQLAAQVKQGEADEGLWKAANAAGGILFRYPSAQVQRTIDGWIALDEGRTTNPGVLLVGPAPARQAN